MKKNAWTLAELTVIIIVILILAKAGTSVTKNININKGRIFVYATIRNLTMGNLAIAQVNNGKFYPTNAEEHDDANATDWYCLNLADAFSIKEQANCADTLASNATNITLSNGVTLEGISSAWKNAYGALNYKDITIDIDGSGGINKLGVDRFPLRVFRGKNFNNLAVDGFVIPVDCDADKLCNSEGTCTTLSHPACSGNTNKIASDNQMISYSIYKVIDGKNTNSAVPIFANRSVIEADCLALGGKGFYGPHICKEKGFKLHEKCAHTETCEGCLAADGSYNMCPGGTVEACNNFATNNEIMLKDRSKQGFKCFSLISKPTGGMGLMGSAVMGEVGI